MEVGSGPERRAVSLRGELDIVVAPAVEAELMRLLHSGAGIRVDLSQLEYIDSIGLRCLLRVARASESGHGKITFHRARGEVERILELTKLSEALPFDE
jgi:anti-sigma B factor antagonist